MEKTNTWDLLMGLAGLDKMVEKLIADTDSIAHEFEFPSDPVAAERALVSSFLKVEELREQFAAESRRANALRTHFFKLRLEQLSPAKAEPAVSAPQTETKEPATGKQEVSG